MGEGRLHHVQVRFGVHDHVASIPLQVQMHRPGRARRGRPEGLAQQQGNCSVLSTVTLYLVTAAKGCTWSISW